MAGAVAPAGLGGALLADRLRTGPTEPPLRPESGRVERIERERGVRRPALLREGPVRATDATPGSFSGTAPRAASPSSQFTLVSPPT